MTKKLNRIISALLAFVMVFALSSVSVFADTYTITIDEDSQNHVYKVYQIFTGDVSGGTLSNVAFGSGIVTDSVTGGATAADVAEALANGSYGVRNGTEETISANYDGDEIVAWLESTYNITLADTPTTTISYSSGYTSTALATGYYLIIDSLNATGLSGTDEVVSSYLVRLLSANLTITPKEEIPEVNKYVYETDDSTDTSTPNLENITTWSKTADYDIGDQVPFELEGTLPTNLADYDTYAYTFHDVQSAGLSFISDSVIVQVDNSGSKTTVDSSCYSVVTTGLSDGCTFEIQFDDIKSLTDSSSDPITVTKDSHIIVLYKSQLTGDSVVIGANGNPNTVYLEYENNPNFTGTGKHDTGTTPEKTVTVFTFTLLTNKVDGDNSNAALAGAGFTLYKYDAATGGYVAVGSELTDASSFVFTGLDAGQYKLVETTTPAGYNTADDIEFKIVATYDSTNQTIESLTITDLSGSELSGTSGSFTTDTTQSNNFEVTTDPVTGISTVTGTTTITTSVVNNSGAVIPETGGIGTKIFYTLGGILVVGAIVLLITRRRMKKA